MKPVTFIEVNGSYFNIEHISAILKCEQGFVLDMAHNSVPLRIDDPLAAKILQAANVINLTERKDRD